MSAVLPDFLGLSMDDVQLKSKEMQLGVLILFKDYRPKIYKSWGKESIFTKRAIRQRLLGTGVLEILLSEFIERP